MSTLELRPDLNAATTNTTTNVPPQKENISDAALDSSLDAQETDSPKAKSCTLCGLTFTTLQEQRDHFKSDFHHYNLKQKMHGLVPVDEKEFDRRIEGVSIYHLKC